MNTQTYKLIAAQLAAQLKVAKAAQKSATADEKAIWCNIIKNIQAKTDNAAQAAKNEKAQAKEAKAAQAAKELAEKHERIAAVAAMNDHQLIAEFIRIFNKKELHCAHCKGSTHITNWVHSIRKRAMRNGLTPDMKLPKTCDDQQARNMISNPVNNPVYAQLRPLYAAAPEKGICPVCVIECIQQRKDGLAAVGIIAKPYKYVGTHASPHPSHMLSQ